MTNHDPLIEFWGLATRPAPEMSVQRTNGFAFIACESRQSFDNDMSLGMSMDVVEFVIYGLLALWGPPLLFAAYLLRPIK